MAASAEALAAEEEKANHYESGLSALAVEDIEGAVEEFGAASDYADAQIFSDVLQASVCISNSKLDDALPLLTEAVQMLDENTSDKAVNLYAYVAGDYYFTLGRYNSAKDLYAYLPNTYRFNGVTVYEREATMAIVGSWQLKSAIVDAYATGDRSGEISTVTINTDELDEWTLSDYYDGQLYKMSEMRLRFEPDGTFHFIDHNFSNGDNNMTWEVLTDDIPSEDVYYYKETTPGEDRFSLPVNYAIRVEDGNLTYYYGEADSVGGEQTGYAISEYTKM